LHRACDTILAEYDATRNSSIRDFDLERFPQNAVEATGVGAEFPDHESIQIVEKIVEAALVELR